MDLICCLFFWSLAVALLPFGGYPVLLWLLAMVRPTGVERQFTEFPLLTMIIVVRNGERFIKEKLENCLTLEYPHNRLEIVVVSDGSTDKTAAYIRAFGDSRIRFLEQQDHLGKAAGLNLAVSRARGRLLVFSDADGLLSRQALRLLVSYFATSAIGGVCGRRVIGRDMAAMQEGQKLYSCLDATLKRMESRVGSITSNDGKLYAIRRSLFRPVPPGVTDDLYQCMNVVAQGFRFLFEPQAAAFIPTPSRTSAHELRRRRRIVARSLHGILTQARVLNPFRYGQFAIGLLLNKVLRRLLPVSLLLMLVTSMLLARHRPLFLPLAAIQVIFYGIACCYPLGRLMGMSLSWAASPYYFVLGNLGTLLGIGDFLRGHYPARWEPEKS